MKTVVLEFNEMEIRVLIGSLRPNANTIEQQQVTRKLLDALKVLNEERHLEWKNKRARIIRDLSF